jgi:4-amino-4-deoxy-L-arabinose transferase-like glycosyltransferase
VKVDPDHRLSCRSWLLLIVFALTLYTLRLGSARTFTGHECYVAEAAREMLATGDWLVPRIAGDPWLEKPPLPHWIVAAVGSLTGGVDEFTSRLPSAFAALLGVILITQLAVRWFGPSHGLLTGYIQATTVYTATYARLAESDIYLWLLVLGCLYLYASSQVGPPGTPRWYSGPTMFFVLLGLTQMVKGPMFGAVIALAPCLAFAVLQRRWSALNWFLSWRGLLLFIIISIAWPAAILLRYPEAWELWKLHTFGRFGEQCINPHPWWYYGTTIPWQILPWTGFVLVALPSLWRTARRDAASPDRFLWLWFLLPLLMLSGVKAKHHHYLIYSLPPCSLWAASGLLQVGRWAERLLMRRSALWVGCSALGIAVIGGVIYCHAAWPQYFQDAAVLAGILITAAAALTAAWSHQRNRLAMAGILAACWIVYGYVHLELMPRTDRYRDETALLERLNAPQYNGATLLVYGYEPARIRLYCRLPLEHYESFERLQARYDELSNAYVITSLGHAGWIERTVQVTCIDHASRGRWESMGAFTQLGVFRLNQHTPAHPANSTTPTSFSP